MISSELRVVAGTATIFGLVFFERLAPLYLIVILRQDLGLSPLALALLPVSIGLGWAGAMGLGRWLSGRLPDRTRIAVAAGGAVAFHLASLLVDSWAAFLGLRFLGGLLAGTCAPAITGLVFHWAPPSHRGRDVGIVFSATRLLGSLVAPVVVLATAVAAGWRVALGVSTGALFVGMLLFLLVVPSAPAPAADRAARRAAARAVLHPAGRRNVAIATAVGILLVTWLTVVSQSGPEVLVASLDISPDRAGAIVGAFGIGGWIAALLVPVISDRIGRDRAVIGACSIGGVAGLALSWLLLQAGQPPSWAPALLLGVGGLAMGALPLALSVIPGEAVVSGDRGRAVTWPVLGSEVVGAALLPGIALLGFLPDRSALALASAGLLVAALLGAAIAHLDPHADPALAAAAAPRIDPR